MGLTAVILKFVNAASVPVVSEITSIERAVSLLGVNKTFSIAFTHVISSQLRSVAASVKTTSFLELWNRSLLIAYLSEQLSEK